MLKIVLSVLPLAGGCFCLSQWAVAASSGAVTQATTDRGFNVRVARPAYVSRHPRVLFDEAHHNADTASGSYRPFVALITSDGYRVTSNTRPLLVNALSGYDVLVIVNPTGPQQRESSAFTDEECGEIRNWIGRGGSLLLIVDHLPFTAAAGNLSQGLNIDLTKGFVIDKSNHYSESGDDTELVFTRESGGLVRDHPITQGRNPSERIKRIITFSGTSLKGPQGSVAFLELAETAKDVLPPLPKVTSPGEALPEHKEVSAAGRAQGIAMQLGKGRIVVLGEAAMLTAQVTPNGLRFGMNTAGFDNRQLGLNIMHWLSGLIK